MKQTSIFWKILFTFLLVAVLPAASLGILIILTYQSVIDKYLLHPELGPLSQKEVEVLHQNLLIQTGLTVFLIIIIISFICLILARNFIGPIRRILEAVKLVGSGNLSVKIPVESKDELGELAASFNEMTKKLKEAREREKTISRMKSEFISLAAHQLRTPLSGVKWTIKMLIDGDLGDITEKQKEFLERSYETNERMISLIRDLLDVARIEEGRFGYDFSFAELDKIIEQEIEKFGLAAREKNIKLLFRRPEKKFQKIKLDGQKIGLALENIIENAVAYTPAGGSVEVSLGAFSPEYIKVEIKDTGVGIPKHQMSRLFTKFFRGENVMRTQTEGSGLGLFIVKNIIKRHGGDIWIESEEGRGTKVTFTLPLEERLIPEKEEIFEEFIAGF